MRISVFPIFALALICGTQGAMAGVGSWTSLGPDGAQVTALAVDPRNPSLVYAGTFIGGVFRSRDGGSSWTGASAGLGTPAGFHWARWLAVDPHDSAVLYAATDQGVFKSTDRAGQWRWLNAGPTPDGRLLRTVRALALDAGQPGTLYAATGGGVFQSVDGGATWRWRGRGLPERQVFAVALSPVDGTLYAATDENGLFTSRDRGRSWQQARSGLPDTATVLCLATHPTRPRVVLAGTDDGLFRSVDGGRRWARVIGPARFGRVFSLDFPSRRRAVAGIEGDVHLSVDEGATWQRRTRPRAETLVFAVAAGPASLLAGVAGGSSLPGVFRSLDDGATWQLSSSGLAGLPAGTVAFDVNDSRVLYGALDGAGLFKSTDGGERWARLDLGLAAGSGVVSIATDRRHPGSVLVAAFDGGVVLLRSDDQGATWHRLATPPGSTVRTVVFDPADNEALLAVGQGLFRSQDAGTTWNPVAVAEELLFFESMLADPQDPRRLWLAGSRGHAEARVFLSEDGGATWERRDSGLESAVSVFQLALDPGVAGRLYAATGAGLHRSDDSGRTWRRLTALARVQLAFALAPERPAVLYAGEVFDHQGVVKSFDGGETWVPARRGLGMRNVLRLEVDPNDPSRLLAASSGGGFWAYTEPDAP